jgi:capsular exopolysaccharide synthesis family protein
MKRKNINRTLLTDDTLSTPFAEAYRALRANITFRRIDRFTIDRPARTILVASASPGEGRTTTAINLGIIMAQSSPSVLIVDTDFRKPSMHKHLRTHANGHGPGVGLSDVLVGAAGVDEVMLDTPFPRLSLITAGTEPPNPSELLGSERMHLFLSELQERADIVLLDSPPCLNYADAFLLARIADAVLYVVRAGHQEKSAQHRVQSQLQAAKAWVLGVVFNDVGEKGPRAGVSTNGHAIGPLHRFAAGTHPGAGRETSTRS